MPERKHYRSKIGMLALGTAVLSLRPKAASALADQSFSLCLAGSDIVTPDRLWTSWSFAPEVTLPLVLLAVLYAYAVHSGTTQLRSRERSSIFLFMTGYGLLVVALVSPLCRLAATLASAHMIQHIILVALAPLFLVLGTPVRILPRIIQVPLPLWLSTFFYGAAIWIWHIPSAYQAALLNAPTHLAMYASLLLSSILFWQGVLYSARGSLQRGAAAILMLLLTLVHTGMLGALLSFSLHLWYPVMSPGAIAWRLSPLEDQQLAGLIMWVPMGAIYFVVAVTLVGQSLARLHDSRQVLLADK